MHLQSDEPNHGPVQSSELDQVDPHGAALERGDEIVQQLSIAKYALAVGHTEQAMTAIDAALSTSRGSLSELAGTAGPPNNPTYAGALVRTTAAGSTAITAQNGEQPQLERRRAVRDDGAATAAGERPQVERRRSVAAD